LTTLPRVLFSPRAFFRDIRNLRGFANPLIFAATCALIGAVLSGVFGVLTRGVPGMQFLATQTGLLSAVIYAFVSSMVGLVIITGVYHLLVMLLAGANNTGLEGTFRVFSYRLRRAGAGLSASLRHPGRPVRPVPVRVRFSGDPLHYLPEGGHHRRAAAPLAHRRRNLVRDPPGILLSTG